MVGKSFFFAFVLALFCVGEIKSEIDPKYRKDIYNIYKHIAIEAREVVGDPVTPDKVNFFLFTKDNPQSYTRIDPYHPDQLNNKNVKIVFIIHGWIESREKQWYEDLKDAFLLKKEEYYVVQVDWTEPAHEIYTISSYNTKDVGHIIGKFIVGLHENYSIPLSNFLLVGHSLGGQVSGFAGRKVQELTNHKLPRIVALDPAGPLFSSRPENKRLNKNDAEVVHVIHTDGGTFGFKDPCGTIDFFPNGGSSQPGCVTIDLLDITSVAEPVYCDHQRSWKYFIEAVLNPQEFTSVKCSSFLKFKSSLCDEEEANMGDLNTKKTGTFYLQTNRDKPFARRRSGSRLNNVLSLVGM